MLMTIFLVHLAGLLSPGPDFFYVVKQSASHSIQKGILASTGIAIGIIFWAAFAIFALAYLSHNFGSLFQALIMLVGGSYLIYIGIKMLKVRSNSTFENSEMSLQPLNAFKEIKDGLLINIFNAKAGAYFSSVISAFVGDLTDFQLQMEILLLFVVSTFIYFSLVAVLFSRRPIRQFYSRYSRYIDNGAGVIFSLFGLKLIFEGISILPL